MEIDYKTLYEDQLERNVSMRDDLQIAKAKLNGSEMWIGQSREAKIDRQRKALQRLNRRVRVQRLQLRKLNELERGLRPDEWTALKTEHLLELDEDQWTLDD